MRFALAAAVAALWILQAPSPQPTTTDREAAYRSNNRGVALLERFAYDEAARAFREALRLSESLDIARLNLAIADFYAGRPAEAATGARAAAARLASNPTAHFVVGLIAKAENRLDDAAAAFSRVLDLDPLDAGSLVSLGQIRLQERQYGEALSLFERALAAEPYNVTAAYNTALALTRAGRPDEGRTAMQRFERLRDSVYGVTYAQTYLAQGRYGEAIASTGAEPELVNAATPAVTFEDATASWLGSGAAGAETGGVNGLTVFDANSDGRLDILLTGPAGAKLFRNNGTGRISDDTSRAGLQGVRVAAGALAADIDNDGRPDLVLLSSGATSLFRQRPDGAFENVTSAAALPPPPASSAAAAAADIDHDGDLDLLLAGATVQVLRNNGNGTFTDISAEAGFRGAPGAPVAIAATDYDNRRDIDVVIAGGGRAPLLYRNMRDGTFEDVAATVGLDAPGDYSALGIGDANKDGYPDLFLARRNAAGALALSDGRGRFRLESSPPAVAAASAAQFVDYDNDGLLDLLTMAADGAMRLARNAGGGRWIDVTRAANLPDAAGGGVQSMALGDIDNDGDTDVILRPTAGGLRLLRNAGGSRNASLRVRLTARVSNRSATGAKVEIRAGSLRQVVETSSSFPAVSPADVLFGLGARQAADVVRVLWPSGILQAETATAPPAGTRDLAVAELDRKPSSCPYLFTWNGTRFEFITDFMGGGEMGGWAGPGSWNQPDPDEYVRIRGDQLQARDDRYELRVTNELEEALFVDRLQLVAVDHPAGIEIHPNEGLRSGPRAPLRLFAVSRIRPPAAAVDEHGHDVLPQIAAMDRRYPDDFSHLAIRGYAVPHALELDLGTGSDRGILLLTGWTDYAFSSDNVAAAQRGLAMTPPSLQVQDGAGGWKTVVEDIGFPVGRPQTIAVDLAGRGLSAARHVRIVTNMRVYWDRVQVAAVATAAPRVTRLNPIAAALRWRGFSAETTPDGREPIGYDYDRVSPLAPWKVPAGRYTREGDVRPLVGAVDDMFAISRTGDEIAVSFDARALARLPGGWTRTFLLYAHGYSKEMNPRSATPDTVAPLPFRAMKSYPYDAGERYPWTDARRRYDQLYNTRVVSRSIGPIEAPLIK